MMFTDSLKFQPDFRCFFFGPILYHKHNVGFRFLSLGSVMVSPTICFCFLPAIICHVFGWVFSKRNAEADPHYKTW